jgi:tetratricopeptide (TPR) repeat protein
MPDDPRVQQLLDELFDHDTTPEEVCGTCPDLLPIVRGRWRQICRARAELDALLPILPSGSSSTSVPEEQPLPQIPGYEVDAVLGHGGMGVVFRARHLKLGRFVALKMTLAGSYASLAERERIRREAEAVAALRHANVVQVYDVGELAGRPYFTMELIEGGSLAQRQAGVPQSAPQAAALLATLAEAVHAAHQGGIIHRDLKPANILFTGDGTPKITDFGLARRLEGNTVLTLSGAPLGTPNYMAPEQARGQSREIGPAADVYALGAILYEQLTGRPPFVGETPTETLWNVIQNEPIPLVRLNRKVPRDLQTICLTCLQKETRHRYVTAAALADDLQRFLRGDPIAARPESSVMRWMRRACQQPVLAAALVIAAISTLAFAGGGLWLFSDRSAKAQAAQEDVGDMVRYLNDSAWEQASAARDRASGRLGNSAPLPLRRRIEQGTRDLELAVRLDVFHTKGAEAIVGGVPLVNYDREFREAIRTAGLGTFGDDPATVARQIRASDIRQALIDAFDWYSVVTSHSEPEQSAWALKVARISDADQSSWRHRCRDPNVLKDKEAIRELIAASPIGDFTLLPVCTLEAYLTDEQRPLADRLALLNRLYQAHPDDFWINMRIGGFLRSNQKSSEALGYIQTATVLRPESAIARYQFGYVLSDLGRLEDAAEQFRRASELEPTTDIYHQFYLRRLSDLGRQEAAAEHLRGLLRAETKSALAYVELGRYAEREGLDSEALDLFTKAVELDTTRIDSHNALREFLLKRGRWKELQSAWQASLAHGPPQHSAWYGYAELCLFLGEENEYLRVRQALLDRFRDTTNARFAETVSRSILLRPASGDELAAAIVLSARALASEPDKRGTFYPYFLFACGLAEYRQGNFDRAIAIMNGDASRVLGPAPRLVLAMALYQQGRQPEARQTLAAVVAAHDWRPENCNSQDAWIYHVLRREAEQMLLPNLAALAAGTCQPQDNDERLALVGIYQFAEKTVALAQLYEDAFTADPKLAETASGHRYAAARAAARAGCGDGADAAELADADRVRWRRQAFHWLRQELNSVSKLLAASTDQSRPKLLQRLEQWQSEEDFADLREPSALAKMSPDERKLCHELWADVQVMLDPTSSPR